MGCCIPQTQGGLPEQTITKKQTVAVTAGSGYIASWIVKLLLQKGYHVNTTVRNKKLKHKYKHLHELPGAKQRLKVFEADLIKPGSFKECFEGCTGVIHTATAQCLDPEADGETLIYKSGMQGIQDVMKTAKEVGTVKTFVLTSSIIAMIYDSKPVPGVLSEKCWSDPKMIRSEAEKGGEHKNWNWLILTKTETEQAAHEFFKKNQDIRFAAINPALVIGEMLTPTVNTSMGIAIGMFNGESLLFSDINELAWVVAVEDCAALHVAAFENKNARGRYLCSAGQKNQSDVMEYLQELNPKIKGKIELYHHEDKKVAYGNDFTKRDTLGVKFRDFDTTWKEAFDWSKKNGHIK